MLRIVALVFSVSKQLAFAVPIVFGEFAANTFGQSFVMQCHALNAQSVFHGCRLVKSHQESKVLIGRIAIVLPYRRTHRKVGCPVAEEPERNSLQTAVMSQELLIPCQNASDGRQQTLHFLRVVTIHPIVIDHAAPRQGIT